MCHTGSRSRVATKALIFSLASLPTVAGATNPKSSDGAIRRLVEGQAEFAANLYSQIAPQPGNLLLSPYSIQEALAMTYAGARGATASQMAATLGFGAVGGDLHGAFAALDAALQPAESPYRPPLTLRIANGLWGDQSAAFRSDFKSTLDEDYGAPLTQVDFRRDCEAARRSINTWVAEKTEGRIPDIFPPGSIHAGTRLALANAIYLRASWLHPFEPNATQDDDFHRLDGRTVRVPMMNQTEHLLYAERDSAQIVQLPYTGGPLAMLIVVPKLGGFAAFEAALDAERIAGLTRDVRPTKVRLTMPRFEYTTGLALIDPLMALGMRDAFDGARADFSGMTGERGLKIDAVVHKAYIRVDEIGTEAAAATGVAVGITSMPPPEKPVVMKIDRPFLFFILHTQSNALLFMGRVVDPSTP